MAVVTMHQIKRTLSNAIAYILNPAKTDQGRLCSANWTDDTDRYADMANRMLASIDASANGRREGGVLAHHVIQSFSPQDSAARTPEELHALGVEFANKLTGGEYLYVIGTHTDRDHTHNHIIVCAVNETTGRKMRVGKSTIGELRKISDRLCAEHGLTILPERKVSRHAPSLHELYATAKGDGVKERMRMGIELAAATAKDFAGFERELRTLGLEVSKRGAHLTFRDTATGLKVRDVRLGRAYDEMNIMARIGRSPVRSIGFHRSLVAEQSEESVRVWLPGSGRRLTLTIPMKQIVQDGQTWRAYLPSLSKQTLTDRSGRYAGTVDLDGLYAYFARPPERLQRLEQVTSQRMPFMPGKTDAQRRRFAVIARKLDALDRLVDELNTLSRLADGSRGDLESRIESTGRRLDDARLAFQSLLVAQADRLFHGETNGPHEDRPEMKASAQAEHDTIGPAETGTTKSAEPSNETSDYRDELNRQERLITQLERELAVLQHARSRLPDKHDGCLPDAPRDRSKPARTPQRRELP